MLRTRIAVAGLAVSVLWFFIHLSGFGGWHTQIVGYRWFAPVLCFVPAWLGWQTWRRAGSLRARRFALLIALAWCVVTLALAYALVRMLVTGDTGYPTAGPEVQVAYQIALLLILVGLFSVPVHNRWSASRLRLGLDMATVLTAGAVHLWYFAVQPRLTAGSGSTFAPVMVFVQTAGELVVLFAIARLVIGRAAEVSRHALLLYAGAGTCQVTIGVLQQVRNGPEQMHLALAVWAVFTVLINLAGLVQLHAADQADKTQGPPRKPSTMLPFVAVAATYAVLVGALSRTGLDGRTWPVVAGSLGLTALVVSRQVVAVRDNSRLLVRIDESMNALRQALAREQILGETGTTLLTLTDRDEVHRLAVTAAGALLREQPTARAAIVAAGPDDPDHFTVLTATGHGADTVVGACLPADAVPAGLVARLAEGEVVEGPAHSDLGLHGFDRDTERPLMLLPLLNGGRFFGVLTVSTDQQLPTDLRKSLLTFRTQVSLALANVALTTELTKRATHDGLTGLGNRAMLRDRLAMAFTRAERSGTRIAVLLLDLNGFKAVNDTYGHDAGDKLLVLVADRLRSSARTLDTVCRLGGDEFVVIAEDVHSSDDAIVIAERILDTLNQPATIADAVVRTPASIGIALSNASMRTPDDLLRLADTAMYVAKKRGAGSYQVHDPDHLAPAIS